MTSILLKITLSISKSSHVSDADFRSGYVRTVCIAHIPDLVTIVLDFCDDSTMVRLSMVDTYLRKLLINQAPSSRSTKKGYLVRILNHKYRVAAQRLDRIQVSLNQGLLVDMRRTSPKQASRGNPNVAFDDSELARQHYDRIQQHVIMENRAKRN